MRTPLVSQILEGLKKVNNTKKIEGEKPRRITVRPWILRAWKAELRKSNYSNCD